ncbi:decorin-binding protein DbpA [Borreliella americana]|uniref:decorin-binding protein DbpA n=1 Tax=Borreliella americana TaxID=478807 RepID=UPI001E37E8AE|nr:decorin-binding protein DbpA [Borreliella americana]MCD2332394.1 decorin-binding protein DbpA [Borreliella americana]MCD2349293.1 decorin-binding protein DbpA [Borreliella americana]
MEYNKTSKTTFKNLLKLTILVKLLISCGLTGETKIRLETSAKDIADEIDKIKKEAAASGVNFEAFTSNATGGKVSGNPEFIRKAKLRAVAVAEKFIKAIEEEATKLKKTGSSGAFSAMLNLMLEVSKPLEDIGVQEMKKTVTIAAEAHPATTAEGVLEIAKKMKEKLQKVKAKQMQELNKASEKEKKK